MIDRGIDLFAKDCGGFNALHLAAELGHDKIVARLLQADPDLVNEQTQSQLTGLHLAAIRGHVVVVKQLLCSNGGHANETDLEQETGLEQGVGLQRHRSHVRLRS